MVFSNKLPGSTLLVMLQLQARQTSMHLFFLWDNKLFCCRMDGTLIYIPDHETRAEDELIMQLYEMTPMREGFSAEHANTLPWYQFYANKLNEECEINDGLNLSEYSPGTTEIDDILPALNHPDAIQSALTSAGRYFSWRGIGTLNDPVINPNPETKDTEASYNSAADNLVHDAKRHFWFIHKNYRFLLLPGPGEIYKDDRAEESTTSLQTLSYLCTQYFQGGQGSSENPLLFKDDYDSLKSRVSFAWAYREVALDAGYLDEFKEGIFFDDYFLSKNGQLFYLPPNIEDNILDQAFPLKLGIADKKPDEET